MVLDQTGKIEVTLWNTAAQNIDNKFSNNTIVAFKACTVSNFNNKSLSSSGGSYQISPNQLNKCQVLKQWLANLKLVHGNDFDFNTLGELKNAFKSCE